MPFTLIPGRFFVVGYSPDGDSMKFQADSVKDWRKLGLKPKVKLSSPWLKAVLCSESVAPG